MTLPVATKNAALDGVTINKVSAHTSFPGSVGSSEVTGGSYARQACVFSVPAGGQEVMTASITFTGLPVCAINWLGFWADTTFRACFPNGGGTPKNFMALASTSTIYSATHGFLADEAIVFYQGTAPGALTEGTTYFAVNVTPDTFQVADTAGGAAITLTAPASFGCVVCAISTAAYVIAGGQLQLTAATVTVPD